MLNLHPAASPLPSLPWAVSARRLLQPLAPRGVHLRLLLDRPLEDRRDPRDLLRSVLGRALANQAGCGAPQQSACRSLGEPCLFHLLYGQTGRPSVRGQQDVRPATLRMDSGGPRVLDISFTLFGPAREHALALVRAIQRAGEMGLGRQRIQYICSRLQVRDSLGSTLEPGRERWSEATLSLLSRTRLANPGSATPHLPFRDLIRAVLRRYTSLMSCYGPGDPPWNYAALLDRAEAVRMQRANLEFADHRRWSQRQRRAVPSGGWLGTVTYRGDLAPFLGLLQAAEILQIGKGTFHGNGVVQVTFRTAPSGGEG